MVQRNNNKDPEDPVLLLLRRIRSQLDQLTNEITDMLEVDDLRDSDNEAALARYDKENDGQR